MSGDDGTLDWKLKLLACANLVVGGLGMAVGLFFVIGSLQPPYNETVLPWVGPLFLGAALLWLMPALLTGWGLLTGKWWAPGMLVIGSVLMLLMIPVGTIIGLFGLYAVFTSPTRLLQVGEVDMRRIDVAASAKAALRVGLIALVALAALGAIIGLGYIFRDQVEQLPPVRGPFGVIVFVVGLGIFLAVARLAGWTGGGAVTPGSVMRGAKARTETKRVVAEHDDRMKRLLADPGTAKYAMLIEAGDYWSDEQIAYDRANQKATCQHLSYLEEALRLANIPVKPMTGQHVAANCVVNWPELSRRLGKQAQVTYEEVVHSEGTREEYPVAMIRCEGCDSGIHTVHSREARETTPKFPR